MRGPIDYIVVGFPGNNFKGEILQELATASENGTIAVLDIALISKDEDGNVAKIELTDQPAIEAVLPADASQGLITDEDVEEVASVLDENCSAGLLIVEQIWAKGLKQAILNADGVLMAEGRIHPEAYAEITEKGAK
jgi:uncharacterized membrane protein